MTPTESILINNELDRMTETYGIEYADYGFTGRESYRVALAIIADREDAIKATLEADTTETPKYFNVSFNDLSRNEFTITPGWGVSFMADTSDGDTLRLKAWHDLEIDNTDDLNCFRKEGHTTPEIEAGLYKIASEFETLYKRAERLMETPGPDAKMTEGLKAYLEATKEPA